MNTFRQRENARWALNRVHPDTVFVSLPIQYKPPFVESSVGFNIVSAPLFDDGTRTYLCTHDEWLAFDREFPTVATLLEREPTLERLKGLLA